MAGYSSHAAGVYGEVQNLGSLVVRLVFWPIELSAFRAFSARSSAGLAGLAGSAGSSTQGSGEGVADESSDVDPRDRLENTHNLAMLQALHRGVALVAAVAAAFGPCYAFAAIHVLLSHRWSATEAPALLATYSCTLALLAVNGVAEAYSHARMAGAQLVRANGFMAAAALVHAALLFVASWTQAGAENCQLLVLFDALMMGFRIAYSYTFMWWLHRGRVGNVRAWVPAPASCGALVLAHVVVRASERRMMRVLAGAAAALEAERLPRPMLAHVGVGAAVLVALLAALLRTERALMLSVRGLTKVHAD
jgi:Rft protein